MVDELDFVVRWTLDQPCYYCRACGARLVDRWQGRPVHRLLCVPTLDLTGLRLATDGN